MSVKEFPTIKAIRTYIIEGVGSGGDYHNVAGGHWLIDSPIATPMSRFEKYKKSRTSWGINVLGSFSVEVEASDGTTGFATGFGGPPACWLVHEHFERFLVGADPRNLNLLWDQMFRASMFYGRKGLPIATISVVDLALWDLLGKVRGEPVYKMIGGSTRKQLDFYCTGPAPAAARDMGFWGAKVPLPYGPDDGHEGLRKNIAFLRAHREAVGPDFPLMVDCYMSLNVSYVIQLATACLDLDINWWEEVLHPDDSDGFATIKAALPQLKFTTGEHEYTRYGFRKLIEGRHLDILQPDVMWVGGLTELLKVTAMAAAYDIPVVPHASGPYSYHYVVSQSNCPFQEYLANSPDGKSVMPVFGDMFVDEPVPSGGKLDVSILDKPGFGLTLNPKARLIDAKKYLTPGPERLLEMRQQTEEERRQRATAGDAGAAASNPSAAASSSSHADSDIASTSTPPLLTPNSSTASSTASSTYTRTTAPSSIPPTTILPSSLQLLSGKTCVITGGATGIGRAIALAMASHGANICINYLDSSQSSFIDSLSVSITPSSRFLAIPGDISDPVTAPALIAAAVARFGELSVYVSNAGICTFADLLTLPSELYRKTVAVNLDGAFYGTQAAARQMQAQGKGGSIIGISSISALVGGAGQTHYTPTKAGVLSLMQSAATALGKYGIRCNAILPGTIQTQLNDEDLKDDEKRTYMEKRIALGRVGVPEDVGGPAVFLASDLSAYVTGAQLLVDGGLFVNLQ